MAEFYQHAVLLPLCPDLNVRVAHWVADLVDRYVYEDAYDLYEHLRQVILRPEGLGLTESEIHMLTQWINNTPLKDVVSALEERGGWGVDYRTPPKATPEQLRIIEEAQREVGLDFSRFFGELTTWEADCVIKGCVSVSEVQRQTGDRHFALRDLRQAIRQHILHPPAATPRGRILKET